MAKKATFKEDRLTQEIVRECFDYHEDGYLIWKDRPDYHFLKSSSKKKYTTQKVGKRAGCWHSRTDRTKEGFGYWVVNLTIGGELGSFKLHRVVFLYHNGYLPEVVDHKDNDTNNNRITNLRAATNKNNIYNMYVPKHNTSGYKGVSYLKGSDVYRAEITCKNVWFNMGMYDDPKDAACVYNYVAKLLFKDFANINKLDNRHFEDCIKKNTKFYKQQLPKLKEGTFDWENAIKRKRK